MRIVLLPLLLLLAAPAPARPPREDPPPLTGRKAARDLGMVAKELARTGDSAAVQEVLALLRKAGHDAKSMASIEKACERSLQKPRPSPAASKRVLQKLTKALKGMEAHLTELPPAERGQLAELILVLDDEREQVQRMLGRVQYEGRWVEEDMHELLERRAESSATLALARKLEVAVPIEASSLGVMAEVYGDTVHMTHWEKFEIHSTHSGHRLQRIVRESFRASAFSHYLRNGTFELPTKIGMRVRRLVLLKSKREYLDLIANSRAANSISDDYVDTVEDFSGYVDTRGFDVIWTSSEVGAYTSLVHHIGRRWRWTEYGHHVPPCLSVGHINWLCLSYFGVGSQDIAVGQVTAPATAPRYAGEKDRRQEMEELGRAGIAGARTWLVYQVQNGEDARWESAMRQQMGEVRGRSKLKTTFVVEYLQERGEFKRLLRKFKQPDSGPHEPKPLAEAALARTLDEFELEWRAWILEKKPSLRQRLEEDAGVETFSAEAGEALKYVQGLRERAFATTSYQQGRPLKLDADLCNGAEAHSRYLNLHPEQAAAWPDAHDEYPDQEGFTTLGCRAGQNSVIAPGVTSARQAIDAWMGTYFHRLPLLDPGMMRMGWGREESMAVLDCSTLRAEPEYQAFLVWPYDGMKDVPVSFNPELPNPLPGEDQAAWGYPITLQYYGSTTPFTMTLYEGKSATGTPVPCHFTCPAHPLNIELVPDEAFCLIPKTHLAPGTTYTVHAVAPGDLERTWSFTTGR